MNNNNIFVPDNINDRYPAISPQKTCRRAKACLSEIGMVDSHYAVDTLKDKRRKKYTGGGGFPTAMSMLVSVVSLITCSTVRDSKIFLFCLL